MTAAEDWEAAPRQAGVNCSDLLKLAGRPATSRPRTPRCDFVAHLVAGRGLAASPPAPAQCIGLRLAPGDLREAVHRAADGFGVDVEIDTSRASTRGARRLGGLGDGFASGVPTALPVSLRLGLGEAPAAAAPNGAGRVAGLSKERR